MAEFAFQSGKLIRLLDEACQTFAGKALGCKLIESTKNNRDARKQTLADGQPEVLSIVIGTKASQ